MAFVSRTLVGEAISMSRINIPKMVRFALTKLFSRMLFPRVIDVKVQSKTMAVHLDLMMFVSCVS